MFFEYFFVIKQKWQILRVIMGVVYDTVGSIGNNN